MDSSPGNESLVIKENSRKKIVFRKTESSISSETKKIQSNHIRIHVRRLSSPAQCLQTFEAHVFDCYAYGSLVMLVKGI